MSPTKEEVAGAVERLERLAQDRDDLAERLMVDPGTFHQQAAIPLKLEARAIRTLLQAYASETAAREKTSPYDGEGEVTITLARYRQYQAAERSLGEALEALKTAREGLSIAAGWARKKGDSDNARQIIKRGLDAIRETLRAARPSPSDTGVK